MNRALVVSLVLASVPALVACDKSGAEAQQQVNEAKQQANREIGQANAQATESQAEAERRIAAAQADFLKSREDYRHEKQLDLEKLDQDIAGLDAKVKSQQTAKGKSDMQAKLSGIHAQRDAFASDFRSLDNATMATWDDAKLRVDKEWSDLRAAVEKAE
jgi:hypothetical protein